MFFFLLIILQYIFFFVVVCRLLLAGRSLSFPHSGVGLGSGVTGSSSWLQWALCAAALHGRFDLLGEGSPVRALEGDLPAAALGGGAAEAAVAGGGALHPRHLTGGGALAPPLRTLQLLTHQLPLAAHLCGGRGGGE